MGLPHNTIFNNKFAVYSEYFSNKYSHIPSLHYHTQHLKALFIKISFPFKILFNQLSVVKARML